MNRAMLLAAACALALALLVLLREAPHRPRTVAPARAERLTTLPPTPASPLPPPAAPSITDVAAIAPSSGEPELPPPGPEQLLPRPERGEPTPAEIGEQKLASLELIARSIERLEHERQDAVRAGDRETAQRNQIRIERLRRRSVQIEAELAGDPQGDG